MERVIIIGKVGVTGAVARLAAYHAQKLKSEVAPKGDVDVLILDVDSEQVDGYWNSATLEVRNELSKYTTVDSSTGAEVRLSLCFPDTTPTVVGELVERHALEFLVNRIYGEWLVTTFQKDATVYLEKALNDFAAMKRATMRRVGFSRESNY